MQNYAQIENIDFYSLHNIFIMGPTARLKEFK